MNKREEWNIVEVFERISDAFYALDHAWRFTYINQHAEELWGRSREELLGKNIWEEFPHACGSEYYEQLNRAIEQGVTTRLEMISPISGAWIVGRVYPSPKGGLSVYFQNVTEYKRAEERLQEAENKYRSIFENAVEGIFQSTPDGRLLTANPALARIAGYESSEEFIASVNNLGQQIYARPEDRAEFISRVLRHCTVVDYEHQGRRKDGSLIWVSTTARAIRGANGDLLGFEGRVIDITERKETQEKLRQSEERYRTVVEEQTELICRFLPDKTITFVNEAYCRYFGMKPEELLGNDFMQLLPSRDQAALEEHLSELSREDPVKTVEHRVFKPDSEIGWQQWTNRAIFDEKGRLVEYQAVGRDVTERKQAEERFRATFEQAAVGFAQVSVDGRMLMVNEKLCETLGYAREELLALHVQDVSYPEDHDADLVQARRLLAGEIDAYTIEKRYVKKDRSLVWTNLVVSLVRDSSGEPEYLIEAVEDITQRKRAEEALRQSEERFRAQYRGIPVPTISWRKVEDDFELVDYNEAADELTQGKLPDFIGLNASEWYSDDPQIIEAMTRCYGEGVTVYQEEPWRMRTTGEQKHLAVTFAYIPPDLVMTHAEDITDRKRAEEALEESNTLLRSIIEGTPDPIFLKDTQGRYLLANSAAAEVMGRSGEDVVGKNNNDLMPPEIAKRIMAVDRRVMNTQESQMGEERLDVQGVVRTYLFTKAPYRDRQGRVTGVIGIARDITERKEFEQALHKSEARTRAIVEAATDAILTMTTEDIIHSFNPAAERIFGYSAEEAVGQPLRMLMSERFRDALEVGFHRYLKCGEASVVSEGPVELAGLRKDGEEFPLELSLGEMREEENILFIGVIRDVTERKRVEEEVRQAKERFHSLVKFSSDCITVLAADGTIAYESPAVEPMLGYKPEELIGKDSFAYIHPNDRERVFAMFTQILDNPGAQPSVEYRFLHADGSWRFLESISSNQLDNPSVQGVVMNSRDVTERKRLEENQQRFLTNAAHQLKTPITTIAGAAELLVTKQDLHVIKRRQLLDHIFDESRHMQRLADTLLRLSRVSWDQREPDLELDLKVVDLAAAVRQAAERMMSLAGSAGLALCVEGEGACVLADPEWLQEVLLILLSNAIKHSSPGRKITLRLLEGAITVEDEGAGISAGDIPYVFERFYKGKGSMEGFGLGLSICRELVEQMGGCVSLSSKEGVGTSVRVELQGAS